MKIPQPAPHGQPQMPATPAASDTAWTTAVRKVSELAHAKLPEAMHGRIERATALAITHGVFFEEDGVTCQVRGSKVGVWHRLTPHCDCEDSLRAPEGLCKHVLGKKIACRAATLLQHILPPLVQTPGQPGAEASASCSIDPQFVIQLHGKSFVLYAGLLAAAHRQKLVELTARFVSVTSEMAVAEATAIFEDGRKFSEAAEATPANVGAQVRPHFARLALVRAKARALRDALNIGMCTVEELGDTE